MRQSLLRLSGSGKPVCVISPVGIAGDRQSTASLFISVKRTFSSVISISTRMEEDTPATKCAICQEEFTQPKILPCFHSFCLECLCDYVAEKMSNGTFPCPLCRTEIEVPERGVGSFQSNFYVLARSVSRSCSRENRCDECDEEKLAKYFCLECSQYFCKECADHHQKKKTTLSHRLMDLTSRKINKPIKRKKTCRSHRDEELQFVCSECDDLLCITCKSTKHEKHTTVGIQDSAAEIREILSAALEKENISIKTSAIQNQKLYIEKSREKLLEIRSLEEEKIRKRADELYNEIKNICSTFLSEIENSFQGEMKQLTIVDERLDKDIRSHESLIKTAEQMLESADDIEVVRRGRDMCKKLRKTINNHAFIAPTKQPKVAFVEGDADNLSETFGRIRKGGYNKVPIILPPKSRSSNNVCGLCAKGENCWVSTWKNTISLINDTGQVIKSVDIGAITNDIVAHCDGNIYISSIEKTIYKLNQEYRVKKIKTLSFYPSGLSPLPESDAMLLCTENDVIKVTTLGKTFKSHLYCSQFADPYRIVVNSNNYACVTDRAHNKVFLFSPEGKLIASYGGHRRDNLATNYTFVPRGVCCNSSDDFVFVDYSNKTICRLDSSGDVTEEFSTETASEGFPWSVDTDGLGRLWVGFSDGTICIYSEL